ncbi:type ISP restriction/modification enzyme, partial [Bartonella sp. AA85SXKL]|uniref:type ISP restriction/modification enzyme n=1 Tax=Bartonella sp. AA85SXKL TaxID=3243440 RepID=UPI0035CEAB29
YRPFKRQWLYYNRIFNHRVYQMPRIFPMGQTVGNRVIQVTGVGASSGFSVLMTKALSNLHTMDTGQCFPRYVYENAESLEDKEGD